MHPLHLLIIPSFYPTVEDPIQGVFFKEQAKMVQQAGVKIGMIYPEIRPLKSLTPSLLRSNYFQSDHSVEDEIPTFRMHGWNIFPGFIKGTMKLWVATAERLFEKYLASHGKPDLIHAQSALWAGAAALKLSQKYDIPFIVTEHRDNFLRDQLLPGHAPTGWLDETMRNVFSCSDQAIAVSHSLKNGITRYLIDPKKDPIVIPNFIDTDFFYPQVKNTPTPFTFLTLAHLYRNKNIHILLEAFQRLLKVKKNLHLKIGGDGPEKVFLEKQAAELGISSHIQFLGKLNRDQAKNAYANASAFVLPSRYETFGIVLIEALSMGLPVIGTFSGGPKEIINDDVGKIVPPDDTQALMEAMASIEENYHQYSPSILREYVVSNFGKEAVVSKWLSAYSNYNFKNR